MMFGKRATNVFVNFSDRRRSWIDMRKVPVSWIILHLILRIMSGEEMTDIHDEDNDGDDEDDDDDNDDDGDDDDDGEDDDDGDDDDDNDDDDSDDDGHDVDDDNSEDEIMHRRN